MNKVLLTIGVPAFNEEKYIFKTLSSIASQNFSNFKVLICDDFSTDNTLNIAEEFIKGDMRFEILRGIKKATFVDNWRKPLDSCNSKYFAWIGAHDILDINYFSEAIDILENNRNAALVYPKSLAIDTNDAKGASMDSDIDTQGLSYLKGIEKVLNNIGYCTAIHGIFVTEKLKKIPLKHIMGFDLLILMITPLYGTIYETKNIAFFRREIRQETEMDRISRWQMSGMFKKSRYGPFEILSKDLIVYYALHIKMRVTKRIPFLNQVSRIFWQRFKVSKLSILKCFLRI
ncbi:MAG: glycosyltransferase family 2 protein [Ferruginibacter sp.]